MVRVSVIIPVYNDQENIITAIQSVEQQSFTDWEIIVVDDKSTDSTIWVVEKYIKLADTNKISIIKLNRNRGPYVAMNEGMLIAKGDFICRLDSDDVFTYKKLEQQVNFMDNNPDIIYYIQNRGAKPKKVVLWYSSIFLLVHHHFL